MCVLSQNFLGPIKLGISSPPDLCRPALTYGSYSESHKVTVHTPVSHLCSRQEGIRGKGRRPKGSDFHLYPTATSICNVASYSAGPNLPIIIWGERERARAPA